MQVAGAPRARTSDPTSRLVWRERVAGRPQEPWASQRQAAARRRAGVGHGSRIAPVLREAPAWFEWRVDSVLCGHDHTLFVARVVDCSQVNGEPLMFYASRYHRPDASGLMRLQAPPRINLEEPR